jgi:hypothetical protein
MIKHILHLCKLYYREAVILFFLFGFSVGGKGEAAAQPDPTEFTDSRYV